MSNETLTKEKRVRPVQPEYVKCPFCGEDDFDLFGLKVHLLRNWCEEFDNLKEPKR